jgi:hypothetical protein
MIFFYGSDFYGSVDRVPGVFEVVTEFSHIYFIPLVPWRSFVVRRLASGKRVGERLPLRWKSVFLAWLRAGLVMTAIVSLIATPVIYTAAQREADIRSRTTRDDVEISDEWLNAVYVALAAMALFGASYLMRGVLNAKYERAVELGHQLGLTEFEWAALEQHFQQRRQHAGPSGAGSGEFRR